MSLDNDIQQLTETVNDHADKIANLQGMVLALSVTNAALLQSVKLYQPLENFSDPINSMTLFSEMSDRAREMADTQLKVFATLRPLL